MLNTPFQQIFGCAVIAIASLAGIAMAGGDKVYEFIFSVIMMGSLTTSLLVWYNSYQKDEEENEE